MKKIYVALFAIFTFFSSHPAKAEAIIQIPEIPHMPVEFYEFSGICTVDCELADGEPAGTVPRGRARLGLIGDTSHGLGSQNFYSFEYDVNPGHSTVFMDMAILFPAFPGFDQPIPFEGVFLDGSIPEGGGPANVILSFPYELYVELGEAGGELHLSRLEFSTDTAGAWFIGIGIPDECGGKPCPDDEGTNGVWSTVPEPASLVLLGIGLVSIAVVSRRRRLS